MHSRALRSLTNASINQKEFTEYGGYEGEIEAMPGATMHYLLAALQRAPATRTSHTYKNVRRVVPHRHEC